MFRSMDLRFQKVGEPNGRAPQPLATVAERYLAVVRAGGRTQWEMQETVRVRFSSARGTA